MKRNVSVKTIFTCIIVSSFIACKPEYDAFSPGELWLDNNDIHINAHGGGMLYEKGHYYWFGEHKIEGEAGNVAYVGVHCYSSKDLYNWKDEGIALSVMPEGSDSDIEEGCILERPKVIYNARTKKYVMWFHLELKSMGYKAARSGLAVSDHVTGPYSFVRSLRPNAEFYPINQDSIPLLKEEKEELDIYKRDYAGGQMARDMTLFVDDDGVAYHIYASEDNRTLQIAELSDDYQSHTGRYARFFVGRFMEAPAIFKYEGRYYLIASGCTGWAPNAARSAVADSIWGPWTELGNPCRGENSEITFGGQSTYILPVVGEKDTYIFMADIWKPENAIDGRYAWLPIQFEDNKPVIRWLDSWKLER